MAQQLHQERIIDVHFQHHRCTCQFLLSFAGASSCSSDGRAGRALSWGICTSAAAGKEHAVQSNNFLDVLITLLMLHAGAVGCSSDGLAGPPLGQSLCSAAASGTKH